MGLVGTILKIILALVLVLVGLGAYLWFTDYGAEATVTDRSADCPPGDVTVTPRLLPFWPYTTQLDCGVWSFVCTGYDVTFHVQTKEYQVREGDRVVYDSASGKADTVGLARCGATNVL